MSTINKQGISMSITAYNNPTTFCKYCGHKGKELFGKNLCNDCIDEISNHSEELHCHSKPASPYMASYCMPFIEDCVEHWEKCIDSCHKDNDCKCQNP